MIPCPGYKPSASSEKKLEMYIYRTTAEIASMYSTTVSSFSKKTVTSLWLMRKQDRCQNFFSAEKWEVNKIVNQINNPNPRLSSGKFTNLRGSELI